MARVFVPVLVLAALAAVALYFGRQQEADAARASDAFLRAAAEQFARIRRAGELEAVWVICTGTVHGALGITDQRLSLATTGGLDAVERGGATIRALPKNLGGARELWGHEVTIAFADGRHHELTVIDRAAYLPASHDVAAVLARIGA